jgi:hypothetical protein
VTFDINLLSSSPAPCAAGPVAEVSTREQCIALHPGSSPGRASTAVVFGD